MSEINPDLIEWHDGHLGSIAIAPETLVLGFTKCFVYCKRDSESERYDIQTCGAELALSGLAMLHVDGVIDAVSGVSDCEIFSQGEPVPASNLLAGIGEGRLELVLTNGSRVEAAFGSARVTLVPPYKFVEVWEGPLISE
ncbi:MAG TPA: hypothetical protein VFP84_31955 [Kofleriaceae bacterium]|nr:hypothetical protein [Kofleriaceae bacterium]